MASIDEARVHPSPALPASGEGEGVLAPSPFCRELRSKKYFTLSSIPVMEEDMLGPDNHCWCRRTMQVVGPDGAQARPNKCRSDRGCYQSEWQC
jgi:hypothetical protein